MIVVVNDVISGAKFWIKQLVEKPRGWFFRANCFIEDLDWKLLTGNLDYGKINYDIN